MWAVKYFRSYILGHRTTVYTDHAACTSLLNTPHPSGKLARWALAIQEMDLIIKHKAGRANMDALSRNLSAIMCTVGISDDSALSVDIEKVGEIREVMMLYRVDTKIKWPIQTKTHDISWAYYSANLQSASWNTNTPSE